MYSDLADFLKDLDRRKLPMLREWLATRSPGDSNSIALDLDRLLNQAEQTYSNYLAAISLAEGQSLTPDLVRSRLAKASESERELLNLAAQTRAQAAGLGSFVERRSIELTRKAHPGDADIAAFAGGVQRSLQPMFYGLIGILILQCALLMVAFHGRFVVAPLQQKLIENSTAGSGRLCSLQ